MSTVAVIAVLAGVAAAGLIRIAARRIGLQRRKRFADAFLSCFRRVAQSEIIDEAGYAWLVARADRMQTRLGPLGRNEPPTLPYSYDAPPLPTDLLIVNTLPELRSGRVRPERLAQCEEAIMRYQGTLDEEGRSYLKQYINPIIWIGEGVRGVLLLPFLALQWLGLFKATVVARLEQSTLFSLFSGLVAVLGLAVCTMILILGWEDFTTLAGAWIAAVR
jgi:hypothetical protein